MWLIGGKDMLYFDFFHNTAAKNLQKVSAFINKSVFDFKSKKTNSSSR
jgi:hypothetical protein